MSSEAEEIIQLSEYRTELFRTAARLAAGAAADGHRILAGYLTQQGFLSRLDTEEEYEQTPGGMRVRKLVEILPKYPSPSAAATLLSLTKAIAFTSDIERREILIENLAQFRPVSTAAVESWYGHWRPNDGFGAKDHRLPPARSLAVPAARAELDVIGIYALSRMPLDDRLQQSIRGVLAELLVNPIQ